MKILLNVAPSGEGCEHIEISNEETGEVLQVITFADLSADKTPEDSGLLRLLKDVVQSRNNADPYALKDFLEGKNLWGVE